MQQRWLQPCGACFQEAFAYFPVVYFHLEHNINKCKAVNPLEAPRSETAGHFPPIFWLFLTC